MTKDDDISRNIGNVILSLPDDYVGKRMAAKMPTMNPATPRHFDQTKPTIMNVTVTEREKDHE